MCNEVRSLKAGLCPSRSVPKGLWHRVPARGDAPKGRSLLSLLTWTFMTAYMPS
ncbi:hypothetical protein [Mastigocladopsis repens]|uniref:hypothetical protein n=1 Tax=Mastigocladopsis repens TaxID=221287 RepID=UPI0002FBA953|nr:hypothetical protein [Mastigocladopsis repens]